MIQFKNKRLTKIYNLSDATFYHCINTIYQLSVSWIKNVLNLRNMEPLIFLKTLDFEIWCYVSLLLPISTPPSVDLVSSFLQIRQYMFSWRNKKNISLDTTLSWRYVGSYDFLKAHQMGLVKQKNALNMQETRRFGSSCTCTKYHAGICSPFRQSVVANDSVSGLWRPCLHMPEDMFAHGAAQVIKILVNKELVISLEKLTHCRLNRLSHTKYWKSPISILGMSSYAIFIFLEKNG